ncbi:hypothetical protein ABZ816_34360 [Actinosynnema sp. NPDC047251]|uniref:Uncharacterized protein n=1 Tax=Saccharothrix espanaensis (strain ATCC 51144 / DSM 44229 / JCM 9112 / NBRC 15066 / NRRL 15764) TaxID=1179773 RepID=K0K1K1_SACES|nr:hypothetical protein [Saccharothrix espanaensis]CCH32216.1 hypothetical protein BN6_49460 [Saccharothrix espanaensis DSM 44229]
MAQEASGGSAFRGLRGAVSVIGKLLDRPRWTRVPRAGLRGDRPLPLICLIGEPAGDGVLAALAQRVDAVAPPKVLFAKVDADTDDARGPRPGADPARLEPPLVPLLNVVRDRLAEDRFGNQRMRRFRYFTLVDTLTRQPPAEDVGRRRSVADDLAAAWSGRRSDPRQDRVDAGASVRAALPSWAQVFVAVLVAWHRPVRYWLWSHRVWPSGSEPRWLMRQRFMVPGHSSSFLGFAERLIARRDENLDELKKLLVHAFLQDLRIAYGSGTVRLRRWRRTAYPLLLLDDLTDANGGWELLRLINDVRNESTEHDPLLVVARAARLPAWMPQRRLEPVHTIEAEFVNWVDGLPARRQSLSRDARFIAVRMPAADEPPVPDDLSAWSAAQFRPRPVPLLARRSVLASTLVVVLAAAALVGGPWLWQGIAGDCLPSPRAGVAVRWIADARSGECLGYSDSAAQVFGDNERMVAAERAIFELNETAERLHSVDPERPLVSLVYFAEFTNPQGELGSADSITEQLTGVLLQQAERNIPSDHNGPLLRVVLANGGYEMGRARWVVDEFLAPLFERDDSLMGVIGMGRTVDPVESAIGVLGDLGVPVVATTLTGADLAGRSPMYFQLVAGNAAQARVVKAYAKREGKAIDVYQPEDVDGDGYLRSLRHEMARTDEAAEPPKPGFVSWGSEVTSVKPLCGTDRIAFFAGRQADFDGFFDRVLAECAPHLRPTVLGADTVARFVAQADKRDTPSYAGIPVLFVSLGGQVVLDNRACLAGPAPASSTPPASEPAPVAKSTAPATVCSLMRYLRDPAERHGEAWRAFGAAMNPNNVPWIGERVGIAYDSAGIFVHAVTRNQNARTRIDSSGRAPNRAAISHELLEMSCPKQPDAPRGGCYTGASGVIDFHESRSGDSRPVTILRLADVKNLTEPPTCVYVEPADPALCPG